MKKRAAVGVAATLAGLAIVLGAPVPVDVSYAAVVLLALLALVLGVGHLADGMVSKHRSVTVDDVEQGYRVPVPGDGFDRQVRSGTATRRVRSHLRERAVASLVGFHDREEGDAERLLDRGAWTDDPVAASFLGAEVSRPPLATRLRLLLTREPAGELRVRRTVDAIERLREGRR